MKKKHLLLLLLLTLPLTACNINFERGEPYKEVTYGEFKSLIPPASDPSHTKAIAHLVFWTAEGLQQLFEVNLEVVKHNWVATSPKTTNQEITMATAVEQILIGCQLRYLVDRDYFLPTYRETTKYYYSPTRGFLFVSPDNDSITYLKFEVTSDFVALSSPNDDGMFGYIKSSTLLIDYLD